MRNHRGEGKSHFLNSLKINLFYVASVVSF